jgi:hypothetical protein
MRVLIAAAGTLTGQVFWALVLLAVITHGAVIWALAWLRWLLPDRDA